MKSTVTNLGHIVSWDGIITSPEKTSAIEILPEPKTLKDVWSFLGFTGYYRRLMKNHARIAWPLNDPLVGQRTSKKDKASKHQRGWEQRRPYFI